jgi:hypothetical protein
MHRDRMRRGGYFGWRKYTARRAPAFQSTGTEPLSRISLCRRLAASSLPLRKRFRSTGKDAVKLRAVEGDQQQVDPGVQRLDHRRSDIVLKDRA